jgi:hypothetical protein
VRRIVFFALVTLALSCRASAPFDAPGPRLVTTFPSYGQAGEIAFQLTNDGPGALGYNLCHSRVERLEGDKWVF